MADTTFKIIKDFGAFGDGKMQKHLTLCSWFDKEPKFDIRPWSDDMTKCGKGIVLDKSELLDLQDLIEEALSEE